MKKKLNMHFQSMILNFWKKTCSSISMTIEPDAFLEVLFLRICGETIKFTSTLKRKQLNMEKNVIADIKALESVPQLNSINSELLLDKKAELEQLRKVKMKGQSVRARLQWLQEEKHSKYFCNLENKNYIEKNIRKLKLSNGSIVTKQEEVLDHIRSF